jgi:Bacterial Ig-like domain (group 2).
MKKMQLFLVTVLLVGIVFSVIPAGVMAGGQRMVAYYKFDGDFTDASGNGNNGTAIGNVVFADGVNGKGARFDGASYIEVNHSDLLNLESGFTFSVWIYKEQSKEQMYEPLIVKTDAEQTSHYDAYYFFNNQDRPGVATWQNKNLKYDTSPQWVDMQKWSLCTVTADSQNIRFYVDGKLIGNKVTGLAFPKSTGKLFIGFKDNGSFGQIYFKGIMDDLKIFDYAMTPAEVQNEYDTIANGVGKYIISRAPGLVGFYRFEGNLNDSSGYGNNGSAVAASNGLAYVDGVAGKALKFDGASYIEVNDSDTLDMDKGFTCSVWINVDAYKKSGNSYQPIIDKLDGNTFLWGNQTAYRVSLGFDDRAVLYVHRGIKSARDNWSGQFATPRMPNQWYMLTITANGETMKAYVDGVLKQTVQKANFMPHSLGKLLIGSALDNYGSTYYKGIMDELRIYNYELKAEEIKNLYGLRDSLSVKAAKTTLARKEKTMLTATLKNYAFASPAAEPNTGAHVIVLQKGMDSFKSTNVTTKAKYTSTNLRVLTVASNGQVTGVSKGEAGVKAVYNPVIWAQQLFKVR